MLRLEVMPGSGLNLAGFGTWPVLCLAGFDAKAGAGVASVMYIGK